MKTKPIILALALSVSTSLLNAQDPKPAPEGVRPPAAGGGPGSPVPHILPRGAAEKLNLTDDQKKEVADLESEVKSKLEKILTPEQLEQLKQMRPPQGQGGPGGGKGEPKGGDKGGPQHQAPAK